MDIHVTYTSVDRYRKSAYFKTLAGAQAFAQKWVGKHPEISHGFGYAVSGDGIGKVTCEGCAIADLFPEAP